MRATRIIWQGAGSHAPHEGDGTPIPPRDPATLAPLCAMCGEAGPRWTSDDAFSDNFRPLAHLSKLYPLAVEGFPVSLCAACVWSSRALRLRCAPFFARADGVWFVPRRQLLAALLDPPEPPFVACAPLYGADHGGEAHGWRATWPGEPALPAGVDVPLWRGLAARLGVMASALRGGGVGVTDTRESLVRLRCAARAPIAVHARWPSLVRGLDRHARAAWWPLLADLVPLPDAPPRPEKAPPKAAATKSAPEASAPPPPPPQPPARKPAQLALF